MELNIAVANRRDAVHWQNKTVSMEELTRLLTTTMRTRETVAEYKAMSKQDQAAAKDHGAFVPAVLKDGIRRKANVVSVSGSKIDKDNTNMAFLEKLKTDHRHKLAYKMTIFRFTMRPVQHIVLLGNGYTYSSVGCTKDANWLVCLQYDTVRKNLHKFPSSLP